MTQLFAVAKDFDLIEKSPVRPSLHRPRRISKREKLTGDLKLSQESLAHSHISTTADIYFHARREAKAGKATELLASQFVPVFPEEQGLVSEMVQ